MEYRERLTTAAVLALVVMTAVGVTLAAALAVPIRVAAEEVSAAASFVELLVAVLFLEALCIPYITYVRVREYIRYGRESRLLYIIYAALVVFSDFYTLACFIYVNESNIKPLLLPLGYALIYALLYPVAVTLAYPVLTAGFAALIEYIEARLHSKTA